jgi:hypothetical protein
LKELRVLHLGPELGDDHAARLNQVHGLHTVRCDSPN